MKHLLRYSFLLCLYIAIVMCFGLLPSSFAKSPLLDVSNNSLEAFNLHDDNLEVVVHHINTMMLHSAVFQQLNETIEKIPYLDQFYIPPASCITGRVNCWLKEVLIKIPPLSFSVDFIFTVPVSTGELVCKKLDVVSMKTSTDVDPTHFPTWTAGKEVDIAQFGLDLVANSMECTGKMTALGITMDMTMTLEDLHLVYEVFARTRDGWSIYSFRQGNTCRTTIGDAKIVPASSGWKAILSLMQGLVPGIIRGVFCDLAADMVQDLSVQVFDFLVTYLNPYLHEHTPLPPVTWPPTSALIHSPSTVNKAEASFSASDFLQSPGSNAFFEEQNAQTEALIDDVMVWGQTSFLNTVDRIFNGLDGFKNPDLADKWFYGLISKNIDTVNCVLNVVTNATGALGVNTYDFTDPYAGMPNITFPLLNMFNVSVGIPQITVQGFNSVNQLTLLQVNSTATDDKRFDFYNKIGLDKVVGVVNASIVLIPLDDTAGTYKQTVKPLYETFGARLELLSPSIEVALRPLFKLSNFWRTQLGPFCTAQGFVPCALSVFDGTWDSNDYLNPGEETIEGVQGGGLKVSKLIISTLFGEMTAWTHPGWDTPLEQDVTGFVQTILKMLQYRFPVFMNRYLRQLGGSMIRDLGNELLFNLSKTSVQECQNAIPEWLDENSDAKYRKWTESDILSFVQSLIERFLHGSPGYNQIVKCMMPSNGLGYDSTTDFHLPDEPISPAPYYSGFDWLDHLEQLANDDVLKPEQTAARQDWKNKITHFYNKTAKEAANMPIGELFTVSSKGFESATQFKFFQPLINAVDDLGTIFRDQTAETIANLQDDFGLYSQLSIGSTCQNIVNEVNKWNDKLSTLDQTDPSYEALLAMINNTLGKLNRHFIKVCSKYVVPSSAASVVARNDSIESANFSTQAISIVFGDKDAPLAPTLDYLPEGPIRGFVAAAFPFARRFFVANTTVQFDTVDLAMRGDFKFNLNTFNHKFSIQKLLSPCVLTLLDDFDIAQVDISFQQLLLTVDLMLDEHANVWRFDNRQNTTYLSDILNSAIKDHVLPFIDAKYTIENESAWEWIRNYSQDSCDVIDGVIDEDVVNALFSDMWHDFKAKYLYLEHFVEPQSGNDASASASADDGEALATGQLLLLSNSISPGFTALQTAASDVDVDTISVWDINWYSDVNFIKLGNETAAYVLPYLQEPTRRGISNFMESKTPNEDLMWTALAFPLAVIVIGVIFCICCYLYTILIIGQTMKFSQFLQQKGRGSTIAPVMLLHPQSELIPELVSNPDHSHHYGVINQNWLSENSKWTTSFNLWTILHSLFFNQWAVTRSKQTVTTWLREQTHACQSSQASAVNSINKIRIKADQSELVYSKPSHDQLTVIDLTQLSQETGISIDTLSGSSLVNSPVLSLWYRWCIPTLLCANFLLLVTALYTNGASLRVIFTFMGQIFDAGTVFDFNVTTLIDYFLYGPRGPCVILFILFGVFCGFFAFVRVPLFLFLWYAPQRVLHVKFRHWSTVFLSYLSRWLLLEAFILSMFVVAFRFNLPLIDSYIVSDTVVRCEAAFFIFLAQSLVSHILASMILTTSRYTITQTPDKDASHQESKPTAQNDTRSDKWDGFLMSHRHTWFVSSLQSHDSTVKQHFITYSPQSQKSPSPVKLQHNSPPPQSADPDNAKQQYVAAKVKITPIGSTVFVLWCIVTLVFLWLGLTQPLITIKTGGMSGWFMNENDTTTVSALDIAKMLPNSNMGLYNAGPGLAFTTFIFYLFLIVVPMAFTIGILLLWFSPMSYNAHYHFHNILEAIYSWHGVDVFAIAVLGSIVDLTRLSAALLGNMCDFIVPFVADSLYSAGLINGYSTCFTVLAFPEIACLWLVLSCGMSWITALVYFQLSQSALQDRYSELKQSNTSSPSISQSHVSYLAHIQHNTSCFNTSLTHAPQVVTKLPTFLSYAVIRFCDKIKLLSISSEPPSHTSHLLTTFSTLQCQHFSTPFTPSAPADQQEHKPQTTEKRTTIVLHSISRPPRPIRANSPAPIASCTSKSSPDNVAEILTISSETDTFPLPETTMMMSRAELLSVQSNSQIAPQLSHAQSTGSTQSTQSTQSAFD